MTDVATEIFKKYGAPAIIIALFVALSIWGLAHVAASPGTEVSVLWGLVKYTKPANVHSANSPNILAQQQNRQEDTSIKKTQQVSVLPAIALEVENGLSPKDYQNAIYSLRSGHKLRQLTSLESGKRISELPSGTYFFISVFYFTGRSYEDIKTQMLSNKVDRFPSTHDDFEIHSIAGNGMQALGFLSESDAARISYLSGITTQDIVLSPSPSGSMTSLVSIPMDRIESSSYRRIQISKHEDHMVVDLKVK